MMRLLLVVVIAVTYTLYHFGHEDSPASLPVSEQALVSAPAVAEANQRIEEAFRQHEHDVEVQSHGVVTKVLPDDNDGTRHQRFILTLDNGMTALVAHNIDLAPRLEGLKTGDEVEFKGVYEWNAKGGVIHWTHHDPRGRHAAGWLRYHGKLYQ
ncbi:Protein of unknown function [Methylobacillus rhizosphaerae]|uniref:DUF3465 domain-containing protein n=1 Tax=Methylobacillus rhizosphaerae TaxID=551994 RepID=A0A238XSQ9_9PROT|nr:DUF3465 domain-containing protein [Methylobacillus rhizosphaerae]SNR61742.1 Protein of unknown function [Methylobacillus rhizosphaerae]